MAKARFTASAETDLLDLWLFIAEDNLLAADDAVDSIYRSAQLLAEQPMMGPARPELAAGLRSFPTQTPYRATLKIQSSKQDEARTKNVTAAYV